MNPLTRIDAANHLQAVMDAYIENYEPHIKELAPTLDKLSHYKIDPPTANPYQLTQLQTNLVSRALRAIDAEDYATATSLIARLSSTND